MPNDLSVLMPKIIARGLRVLRQGCIMPQLVNGDYSKEARQKGDTIDVPITVQVNTRDVTPSEAPIAGTSVTPTKVQVPLSNWRQNDPIMLSDHDMVKIAAQKDFLPGQMTEAIKSLSRDVNISIMQEYKGVYGAVGTAGTTPFGSSIADAINAKALLNAQLCPRGMRRGVLDVTAEAAAELRPEFSSVDRAGSSKTLLEGGIGRKFGIDWYSDDDVLYHTTNAVGTGALTVNGAHAAATTAPIPGQTATVSIAKGAGANWSAKKGDLIRFAGDAQTYVITADVTVTQGTNTNVVIAPGLQVAKSGSEAVTVLGSHRVNLAFHREAIAYATRPLADVEVKGLGTQIMSLQDPQTGMVLRLEVTRQHKQVIWEFDLLWGVKLVDPRLCVRILG